LKEKKDISLLNYVIAYKWHIVLTLLCTFITVAFNLLLPVIMRYGIDALTAETLSQKELLTYAGTYMGIVLISLIFSRGMRWFPLRLSENVAFDLRRDLFGHLTHLERDFFQRERTGDLMTRMISDITLVKDFVGQGLLQGIRATTIIIMGSISMYITSPELAGVMALLFPAMIASFYIFIRLVKHRQEKVQEKFSDLSSFTQETFAGIRSVKSFAIEKRRFSLFRKLNEDLIKRNMKVSYARQPMWPLFAFWFSLGIMLILLIGGRQVILQKLTLGKLVQFIQYMMYIQWPMLAMSWVAVLIQRGRVSWTRLLKIFNNQPAVADADDVITDPPVLQGKINFKNINYNINGQALLSDINLTIPEGTTIGITGPTGGGKTILASLIARIMDPTSGTVEIDDIPLKKLPLQHLRAHVGFAAQEPVLFSRTLAENISFGLDDKSEETILWASDIAHLHNDVTEFHKKYETVLGERGITLSGGQRQRTSISRAIARKPSILILDDVLASVDTHTESSIMEKLQPAIKNRTTIIVSHRVSTLRYASVIATIEDGKITQYGTHDELIKKDGYYARLNRLQQIKTALEETE
jgi:ATP-binding cassette subfamily B protein